MYLYIIYEGIDISNGNLKSKIFISCGQTKGTIEEKTVIEIKKILENDLGFEVYIAIEESTLNGLRENIFKQLCDSEYFLFIDFKRERIKLLRRQYRGSLYAHQELAVASFLDIKFMGFQQNRTKNDDGMIKVLQANCKSFDNPHELPELIKEEITRVHWKNDWKNQLSISRDPNEYEDANINIAGHQLSARFFHLDINNLNPNKQAINCYGFLEYVKDLNTNNDRKLRSIEFKWAGYVLPNSTIMNSSSRQLDTFYVIKTNPTVPHFSCFSDSTYYLPYINTPGDVHGPGDYELEFLVVSDNFLPTKSTFVLHLDNNLNQITFVKK